MYHFALKKVNSFYMIKRFEFQRSVSSRVARWFVLEPKIPIWVNFAVP
jgi:hypothetical protein